jgi:hypothetical protein
VGQEDRGRGARRDGRSPVDRADQGVTVPAAQDSTPGFIYDVETGRLREVT